MPKDLLHPSAESERAKHKLKRLVQSPNSFFMDVKCPGCFNITTVFSHAQVKRVVLGETLYEMLKFTFFTWEYFFFPTFSEICIYMHAHMYSITYLTGRA